MPRLTLIEWGGRRHGTQAYKDRKFKFKEVTVRDLKEAIIEYFAGKILDQVAVEDIVCSPNKGATAAPLEIDSFAGDAGTTLAAVWPGCKKRAKLYFSLTSEFLERQAASAKAASEATVIPSEAGATSSFTDAAGQQKQQPQEGAEEKEGKERQQSESFNHGECDQHPSAPSANIASLRRTKAPESKTINHSGDTLNSRLEHEGGESKDRGKGYQHDEEGETDEDKDSSDVLLGIEGKLDSRGPLPQGFLERQEYEKKNFPWIRYAQDEKSDQYRSRNTISGVIFDQQSCLFPGYSFSKNSRRFGWMFGKRKANNWVRVDAVYEPPQHGLLQNLLLRPDPYFDEVVNLANSLGLDVVGCVRTRGFRIGPFDIAEAPTASEALFMAKMQARFDDGHSNENAVRVGTGKVQEDASSSGGGARKHGDQDGRKKPDVKGHSFVSIVLPIDFQPDGGEGAGGKWTGELVATQVSRQLVALSKKGEVLMVPGEEYVLATKTIKVHSQMKDPVSPNLPGPWKVQKAFSTAVVHVQIPIVAGRSWLRPPRFAWDVENRVGEDGTSIQRLPTKRRFKVSLQQFNRPHLQPYSLLDLFKDFHFLIWLKVMGGYTVLGLSPGEVDSIVEAVRVGDLEECESFRHKLEALAGVGFRDPFAAERGLAISAPESDAEVFAQQIVRKYRNDQTPVVCPIRSALSMDRDLRHQKYSGIPKAYESAINGAGHFSRTHPACTRADAVIALVAAPVCGGPEEALLRWKQLTMGITEAEAKQAAEMEAAIADAKRSSETDGDQAEGGGFSFKRRPGKPGPGKYGPGKSRPEVEAIGPEDASEEPRVPTGVDAKVQEETPDPTLLAAEENARAELATLSESKQIKAITLQTQSEQLGLSKTLADCLRALKLYRWDDQAAINSFFD